jgi:hypothetical protein
MEMQPSAERQETDPVTLEKETVLVPPSVIAPGAVPPAAVAEEFPSAA